MSNGPMPGPDVLSVGWAAGPDVVERLAAGADAATLVEPGRPDVDGVEDVVFVSVADVFVSVAALDAPGIVDALPLGAEAGALFAAEAPCAAPEVAAGPGVFAPSAALLRASTPEDDPAVDAVVAVSRSSDAAAAGAPEPPFTSRALPSIVGGGPERFMIGGVLLAGEPLGAVPPGVEAPLSDSASLLPLRSPSPLPAMPFSILLGRSPRSVRRAAHRPGRQRAGWARSPTNVNAPASTRFTHCLPADPGAQ